MPKRKSSRSTPQSRLSTYLRKPAVQLTMVALVALIVYLIALSASSRNSKELTGEISVDKAYQMHQSGAFVVDVRRQDEWDAYHAPNTHLIPLDELPKRLNEIPKDQQILVICHSGNRSKQGRDILVSAGYNAVSITGGLLAWIDKGYPLDGNPPAQ